MPAAPGQLIALMDHSQVEREEYMDRGKLLDVLDDLKDLRQTTTWGLDVLDVKVYCDCIFLKPCNVRDRNLVRT